MKKSSIGIISVIAVIAIIVIICVSTYNGMVTKKESVDNSFSNLDVMLQRRADLIPNLVNTVKGYTNHENDVIDKVLKARTNLLNANNVEEKSKANKELTTALDSLTVVVENYPDLKASENYMHLSDELAGTENRIAVARKDYNDAINKFNTSIKRFPNNIFAGMFGFNEMKYFQADDSSAEVPSVEF